MTNKETNVNNTAEKIMPNDDIVIVPESLANNAKAGAMVHWRLSGYIDQEKFKNALGGILPENMFPSASRAEKYLREAMETLTFGPADLIRKLDNGKGFSLVRENRSAIDLERIKANEDANDSDPINDAYLVTLTGKIITNKDGSESIKIIPENHPQADDLKAAYEKFKGLYSCTDISQWLSVKIMPFVNATPYRDRGGIYILTPGADVEHFSEIAMALHSISTFDSRGQLVEGCKAYTVPIMSTEYLQEAVIDSLREELDKLTKEVVTKVNDNTLSLRGWDACRKEVHTAFDRFKKVEQFLGLSLEELTNQLNELEMNIGTMEVTLQAEKEEEAERKRLAKLKRVK